MASGPSAEASIISNGGFEDTLPGSSLSFQTVYPPGTTVIPGWTVISGSVDVIGSYWTHAEGDRSIDLDGVSTGTIETVLNTVAGEAYTVTFALSGHRDRQFGIPHNVRVSAAGSSQDYQVIGATGMNWTDFDFSFTASSTATALRFQLLENHGTLGPGLDHVRVVAGSAETTVPLAPALALFATGLAGLRRRMAKVRANAKLTQIR